MRKMAGGWGRFSDDLAGVLEAQVLMNKNKSSRDILRIIKSNSGIVKMMRDEGMTDRDLRDFLEDTYTQFIRIGCRRTSSVTRKIELDGRKPISLSDFKQGEMVIFTLAGNTVRDTASRATGYPAAVMSHVLINVPYEVVEMEGGNVDLLEDGNARIFDEISVPVNIIDRARVEFVTRTRFMRASKEIENVTRSLMTASVPLQVGDILVATWGYDQTNASWFKVIGLTGSFVVIREMNENRVNKDNSPNYTDNGSLPVEGSFRGPIMRRMVQPSGSVKINSYMYASKWDGRTPVSVTPFGLGH